MTCAYLFPCLRQCALNCLIIVNFVCFRASYCCLTSHTHARTHTCTCLARYNRKYMYMCTALYTYPNQPGEALYFRGRACPLRLLPFQGKLYHPIHDEETRGKAKMKSNRTSRMRKPYWRRPCFILSPPRPITRHHVVNRPMESVATQFQMRFAM